MTSYAINHTYTPIREDALNTKSYKYNDENYEIIKYDKSKMTNDNINTYGLYRSLVCKDNKMMTYSPPKSYPYDLFTNMYDSSECVAEEYIEGTMINMFYDNDKNEWELATRSSVGGKVNYFNRNNMTFRKMFLETCNSSNLEFNMLDKNLSYSFVMQHPNNRIVIPFTDMKLYLVACYKINNENCTIDVIDINGIKESLNKVKIYYPKQYTFELFCELVNIINTHETYTNVGIMIHNHSKGTRTKIRNEKYEYVRKLRGNQPKLQYRYMELRMNNQRDEYLKYFPEDSNYFRAYETEIRNYTTFLYNYYVGCFIYKQSKLQCYPYEYKLNMYELHEKYKNILKPNNRSMSLKFVIEYVNSLPPAKLMYAINYNKRPNH